MKHASCVGVYLNTLRVHQGSLLHEWQINYLHTHSIYVFLSHTYLTSCSTVNVHFLHSCLLTVHFPVASVYDLKQWKLQNAVQYISCCTMCVIHQGIKAERGGAAMTVWYKRCWWYCLLKYDNALNYHLATHTHNYICTWDIWGKPRQISLYGTSSYGGHSMCFTGIKEERNKS